MEEGELDKYEQHVDLMNECRSFYYSRIQKTEHYKEVFKSEPPTCTIDENSSSFASSMRHLQTEIVSLLDQDLTIMRQLLTLNETIEEMKNRPLHGFSKESFGSNCSMFYPHTRLSSENECHLSTVTSESEMENMCQKEGTTVFEDIQNLVYDDDTSCDNTSLHYQVSADSGFVE